MTKKKNVQQPKAKASGGGSGDDEQRRVEKELRKRWKALHEERLKAEEVLRRHHDDLIALPEVTGLHVGFRRKGPKPGKIAFPLKYCIQVCVANKWAIGHPRLLKPLETQIEGVPVDVIERTYSFAQANPIRGGMQINSSADPHHYGTLGIVVFAGNDPLYLTNQHVAGSPGTSIMQPANGAVIGTVLSSVRDGVIDAAVITPNDPQQPAFEILMPDGSLLPTPALGVLTSSDVGMTQCFKIGAATGGDPGRTGTVQSIQATIQVTGQPIMTNQIVVTPPGAHFVDRGDSGSLLQVPAADVNRAVGLVWAVGDDGTLVACHLDKVLTQFNVTLTNV
ncbi:MAG TPA: hypothetical protein VFG04_27730 [Planctomycetaceae bacterium]|nr:hypothetical protein [Planctomycetaceae bacterium]